MCNKVKKIRWGNWFLDSDSMTLDYHFPDVDGAIYDVNIGECDDSAKLLDWIFQVIGKSWANEKVIYDLLSAIDEILMPQAHLCSCGENKTCNAKKIVANFINKK